MTKQLICIESATGRLEAIPPGQATGIPIPTAQVRAVRPAAGTVEGELFYETSTNLALIWDGSRWNPVQSDFLHLMPDDASALAGGFPLGHVAISEATGNFFVNRAQGVIQWGIREFATQAALLADTATADGQIAMALDTGAMYIRNGGTWHGTPVAHFATEADLLAATPADGTLAWGDDTGLVYTRHSGVWTRVNSPTVTIGPHPATPATGDLNYRAGRGMQLWDGTAWQDVGSGKVPVSATAPTNPQAGDLWFDTTHGTLVTYDGSTWKTPNFRSAAAGVASRPGDIWYDTTNNVFKLSTGSRWVTVGEEYPRFTDLSWDNAAQGLVDLDPNAKRNIRLKGHVYATSTSNRLGIIGQDGGNWTDWSTLVDASVHTIDHGNSNNAWQNYSLTEIYKSNAGMCLTRETGIKNGTRAFFHIELTMAPGTPLIRWEVRWITENNSHRVTTTGWGLFRSSFNAAGFNRIGMKMFSNDAGAVNATSNGRVQVEYS